MVTFLENAQRIFDVARADCGGESSDFTLLVGADGSLRVIMEQTVNPQSAAIETGARMVYRVKRSHRGVTISGREGENRCELTSGAPARPGLVLRDQRLYLLAGQDLNTPLCIGSAS